MTVNQAYLQVTDLLNKLSSNSGDNIPKHSFVTAFNKMQLQWTEDRFKMNDLNTSRIEEIQQLLLDTKLKPKPKDNYYYITLPNNYFHYKRSYSISGDCTIINYKVKEGDVNILLSDDNWKPSLEWGETICSLVGGQLRVYADFPINEVALIYYRFPLNVNMADGYTDVDGNATTNIDPEFTGSSLEEILTMTANYLTGATMDQFRYQVTGQSKQAHT